MDRYMMALKKNNIPLTSMSVWEKDPVKTYMKITLAMGERPMFNAVLFDRYILGRNPMNLNIGLFGHTIKSLRAKNFHRENRQVFF